MTGPATASTRSRMTHNVTLLRNFGAMQHVKLSRLMAFASVAQGAAAGISFASRERTRRRI